MAMGDGLTCRPWKRGGWSDLPPLETGNFYALTAGDLNRDGHMDLFAGTYRNGIRIYLGDGRGGFLRLSPPVNKNNFWKVLAGNVDSDGGQELVVSSLDSKGIWAWKWKNGGLSPLKDFYGSSGTYYDMALTDLDSDGRQDLIAASDGQGVRIWASQAQVRSLAAVNFGTAGVPLPDKGEEAFPVDPAENEVFVTIDGRGEKIYCAGTTRWQYLFHLFPGYLYIGTDGIGGGRSPHSETQPLYQTTKGGCAGAGVQQ
jgi:hypothetical protein